MSVEYETRLAEQDIVDIRERYHAFTPQELDEKIESHQIYSHPAWEDLKKPREWGDQT